MSFASGIPSGAASSALGAAARQVPLGRPWRRADPPAASPSSAAVSSPPASVRRCGCLPRGPGRPYHDREAVISIKAAFLRTHLPWPPQAQDSPTAEASISILRSQVSVLRRADGSLPSCSMSADATPSVSLSATWANAAPRAWRRACSCCRLSGRLPSARAPPRLATSTGRRRPGPHRCPPRPCPDVLASWNDASRVRTATGRSTPEPAPAGTGQTGFGGSSPAISADPHRRDGQP